MLRKLQKTKGFTLIEALIIVAIIGILITIIVITTRKPINDAKQTKYNDLARILYVAANMANNDKPLTTYDGKVILKLKPNQLKEYINNSDLREYEENEDAELLVYLENKQVVSTKINTIDKKEAFYPLGQNIKDLYKDFDGKYEVIIETIPKTHITDNIYSVKFYNDDELLKEESVNFSCDATPPKGIPKKEGYVFVGWDKSYQNIKSNLEINAKFVEANCSRLKSGQQINSCIKSFLNQNDDAMLFDEILVSIKRNDKLPIENPDENGDVVNIAEEGFPVYIWLDIDEQTLYWYSQSNCIYMNEDSSYLFNGFTKLIDLSDCIKYWDTSFVKNAKFMFMGCESLNEIDVSKFDTRHFTELNGMFMKCFSLENIKGLDNWETNSFENVCGLFYESGLKEINLSTWDTSNIEDMSYMFSNCFNLETINISSFDTSNVVNMEYMFSNCKNIKELDLSSFKTFDLMYASYMFCDCKSLNKIYVSNDFVCENINPFADENMFLGCSNLEGNNGTKYDEEHIKKSYACIDGLGSNGYFSKIE